MQAEALTDASSSFPLSQHSPPIPCCARRVLEAGHVLNVAVGLVNLPARPEEEPGRPTESYSLYWAETVVVSRDRAEARILTEVENRGNWIRNVLSERKLYSPTVLPTEIMQMIFSHLDPISLARASQVCYKKGRFVRQAHPTCPLILATHLRI